MIEWFRLLRWQQWEGQLATLIWLASLALANWYPATMWVVLATTINLLHSRYSSYFAGTTLKSRVMGFLNESLADYRTRFAAMEKDVADVKEAQIKIAGAWRGRNLP
jgi:hypothetical protein